MLININKKQYIVSESIDKWKIVNTSNKVKIQFEISKKNCKNLDEVLDFIKNKL